VLFVLGVVQSVIRIWSAYCCDYGKVESFTHMELESVNLVDLHMINDNLQREVGYSASRTWNWSL
jgi:hypothetical protein